MTRVATPSPGCPCGSGNLLQACCGPYLGGTATAPTAEALMRSRYTAYVMRDEAYLRTTWQERNRPAPGALGLSATTKWLGLEVRRHAVTGADSALVEFVARYKVGGRAHRIHEVSRFVREAERWLYLDAAESPG